MILRTIVLAAVLALVGCSAPTVPDFTYYRLPPAQPLPAAAAPVFALPLVVDEFGADGVYADQALIYALDASARQLRQYHYQLWTDPPTRILQRRLVAQLRATRVAAQVTDELPASQPAIRIGGVILHLDRVPDAAGGYRVAVALKLRADGADGLPWIDEVYHADRPATGRDLRATVDAYGAALDAIFAQFYADLRQHGVQPHVG